jgi:tRNA(Arg) A34 adenosine deaminase TadA
MASDKKMLLVAAGVAAQNQNRKIDNRSFLLGAVGQRNDGVIVSSRNIAAADYAPGHHAETRLIRKLTPGSIVWVTRVTRGDGLWALARPCSGCELRLRGAGVERVVYTIGPNEWGVIVF